MSIEGEVPAGFSFDGERASENELQMLEGLAFELSEIGAANGHRQFVALDEDSGNVIFLKTHYEQELEDPQIYASIGVAKGSFDNVQMKLTFAPSGELCDTTDTDEEELENSLKIMEDFLRGDELDDPDLEIIVGNLISSLKGECSFEFTRAFLMAEPHEDVPYVRGIHGLIRTIVEDNTAYETRLSEFSEVLNDYEVISVYTHELIGEDVDLDLLEETGYCPLAIKYEDRRNLLHYVYSLHYDGAQTLQVFNPLEAEYEGPLLVADQDDSDINLGELVPGSAHTRLLLEKLQEASIRIRSRELTIDKSVMNEMLNQGSQLLQSEIEEAHSVHDYVFRLLSEYNETQMFENLKEVALAFGMFENQDDQEYTKEAVNQLLKGLLLGLHVAARTLADDVKEKMDEVDIGSICVGEVEPLEGEAVDVTDDTASLAEIYYDNASQFHHFFDMWEDRICPDMHFQRYLKRGFGFMLSIMDRASKLHADEINQELDMLRILPEGEMDLDNVFAEIELFLSDQPPSSEY